MSISFNSAISAYNTAANIGIGNNSGAATKATKGEDVFASLIEQPVANSVSSMRQAEKTAINNLMKKADISDVATALQDAEVTLKTVVAVRDRIVSAIQELEKMPI